jgi:transcriptional regulator with XRE-family HTH domain
MLNTTEIFLSGTSENISPLMRTYRQTVPVRDMLPYRWLAKTTGSDLSDCRAFLYILVRDVASDNVITGYQTVHVSDDQIIQEDQVRKNVEASVELNALPDEARRLREISGLTVEQLAEMFHISRPAFHEWLRGSSLTNKHREHLLEVLPLVEEALQRFGSPNATSTWLLTPVSPAGKKPIVYLSERQYTVFRGFLLRQPSGQQLFRPLTPSKRVYKERSREEVEDVRERLRPRVQQDEIGADVAETSE